MIFNFFIIAIPYKEVTHSRPNVFTILVFYLKTMVFANCWLQKHQGFVFPQGSATPNGAGPVRYQYFTIAFRHISINRTDMEEWSARSRELLQLKQTQQAEPQDRGGTRTHYLSRERPQTKSLDRAATRIDLVHWLKNKSAAIVDSS